MWGAIIGDLAGSIYEYSQYKKTSLITVDKIIDKNAFFSDDTILTVAIYDAILHDKNYEKYLRMYGKRFLDYKPNTSIGKHFESPFGSGFKEWLLGKNVGNSIGNGAMMRISGVGFMFDRIQDVEKNAKLATIPSHNSIEAISCATTIAKIIYYAQKGMGKDDIMNYLGMNFVSYKPFEKFNKTCNETIGNCLYVLFTSHNFEEAIRSIITLGGDTDTNACIVGAMAEALYGVPGYLIYEARRKLPKEVATVLDRVYYLKRG